MDYFTAALAIYSALQPRVEDPDYRGPVRPDRSAEYAQLVNDASNPQSDLYRMAQERYTAEIGGQMARMGMQNSSLANQAQQSGSATIANKFLEDELMRRERALKAEAGYYSGETDYADQGYSRGLADQKRAQDRDTGVIKGIGDLASVYFGGQERDAAQASYDARTSAMNNQYYSGQYGGDTRYSPYNLGVK